MINKPSNAEKGSEQRDRLRSETVSKGGDGGPPHSHRHPMHGVEEEDGGITDSTVLKALSYQLIDAMSRSRNALLALLLSAIVLTVGAFNYRHSWLAVKEYREMESRRNEELREPVDPAQYGAGNDALIAAINRESENMLPEYKRTLFHDVFDGLFKTVDVPVIGVEIYVEDLPLLGAFAISVVLVWFLFARRRERGITKLLRNKAKRYVEDPTKAVLVEFIYHATGFNQMFNTVEEVDKYENRRALNQQGVFASYYLNLLAFLPVIVLFCVIAVDCYETYWWKGPLRMPDPSSITAAIGQQGTWAKQKREDTPEERMERFITDSLQYHLRRIARFDSAARLPSTRIAALVQYRDSISAEREQMRSTKEELHKALTRSVVFYEFVEHHRDEFNYMARGSIRLDILNEIFWLRTVLPIIMILICLALTLTAFRTGLSKDEYCRDIEEYHEHAQLLRERCAVLRTEHCICDRCDRNDHDNQPAGRCGRSCCSAVGPFKDEPSDRRIPPESHAPPPTPPPTPPSPPSSMPTTP